MDILTCEDKMGVIGNRLNLGYKPAPVPVTTDNVAERTAVDNIVLNQRMRSFTVTAGQTSDLQFTFQNKKGNPYDLTDIAEDDTKHFEASFREMAGAGDNAAYKPEITIKDATNGLLNIHIDPKLTSIPGVYKGQIALMHGKEIILVNTFLLYVSESVLGKSQGGGPPTILEIRLQLSDSAPEENYLLSDVQFTDEEIAIAVARPVQYFNETNPNIGIMFTTTSFPWRYHWIVGATAQLFFIAEERYRKNSLDYQAGGLQVADMSKERNYQAAGQVRWKEFQEFVKFKKAELNMEQGWGDISSPYNLLGWYY